MVKRSLSSAEFRSFRPTKRLSGEFFVLSLAPSQRGFRYACVISKKNVARASARNLIKRRCRAALFDAAPPDGFILVFSAKRGASYASFEKLSADIRSLVAKLAR